MGETPWRPTREQLEVARERTIPDVLADQLRVVFVGINPGLYSGAVGHHFARPGNRFWPTLHAAGFTPRRLRPDEDAELPAYGIGVTNIAFRPTRAAARANRRPPRRRDCARIEPQETDRRSSRQDATRRYRVEGGGDLEQWQDPITA